MITSTITPYRPGQQVGRDGFAQLVRAEWTKFRTVRGWVIGMIVAALVTVLIGILTAIGAGITCQASPTSPVLSGQVCLTPVPVGPGGDAVSDSFYFVRQALAGDGTLTVRVTSLGGMLPNASGRAGAGMVPGLVPWAKAGIIVKESTRQGSPYAAMIVTGAHGVRMQDNYTQDMPGLAGAVSGASPRWLRLTRSGDTITGYDSADGTRWFRVGTTTLAGLPATVQAGLFATSPAYSATTTSFGGGTSRGGPSTATGIFDHVGLRGAAPGSAWAGQNVQPKGPFAGPAPGGFSQAGGKFTVTGSGDIGPAVAGAAGGSGATVSQTLAGVFAGLIAVVVIAAMFITAEYRRGLIRTTLTASPRRGRVLAAKAVVLAAVAFVVGLVAAGAAVALIPPLERSHGTYLFPATFLTEVRVVAGTAALLAVAAVLALAIGTVLRRSAAAVTAVIVAIILPYILGTASVLPVGAADWLLRLTPAAAFAIQQSMPQYPQVTAAYTPIAGYFPLAPWAGFAVLCGYAVLALALAAYLLRKRDA